MAKVFHFELHGCPLGKTHLTFHVDEKEDVKKIILDWRRKTKKRLAWGKEEQICQRSVMYSADKVHPLATNAMNNLGRFDQDVQV